MPGWHFWAKPNVATQMQTKGDSSTQKNAFAVLTNLRSLPVLSRPRRAHYCTQDLDLDFKAFALF